MLDDGCWMMDDGKNSQILKLYNPQTPKAD